MQGPNRQADPQPSIKREKTGAEGEHSPRAYLVQVPRPGTQARRAGVSPGTSWGLVHAA